MFAKLTIAVVAAALALVHVKAETHTVSFTNNRILHKPYLWGQNGVLYSSGEGSYTSDGPLLGLISFCLTGNCGNDGEGCTTVEATLENASNSAADITLISPHEFSVTSGFGFYGGCDGAGEDCTSADCPGAFTDPTNGLIVSCSEPNVNIAITFCD
ncbi:hypothetical protein IEO21_02644 [Rhodonia placenta]|uniref:Glycopeptide n=1 Tax=Rhodonia placenta TaxID=104341 RepID=A0A8H7P7A8_9APHY|nr:hypothetical protein IEO21_02644 [Postia placenta]